MHPAQLQLFTFCNLHPPRLQQRRLQKLRLLKTEAFNLKLVIPSAICIPGSITAASFWFQTQIVASWRAKNLKRSPIPIPIWNFKGASRWHFLTRLEVLLCWKSQHVQGRENKKEVASLNRTWSIILLKESTCAKERESAESGLSVLQPQPQRLYSEKKTNLTLLFY